MTTARTAFALSLVFLLVAATSPAFVIAQDPARVLLDPASLTLRPGEIAPVTVLVTNATDVYGLEFHLRFDPAIVEVVDAESGLPASTVAAGDWLRHGFAALNRVNNAVGTIDYAVTLLNPSPAVSGGGPVAVIAFKGKAVGASALTVQQAILASRQGKEITSQWQSGTLTVSSTAAASAPTAAPGTASSSPLLPLRVSAPELVVVGCAVLAVGTLAMLARRRKSPMR